MKPVRTNNEKFDLVFEKLSKRFPNIDLGGVSDDDGFSFDFPIPENQSGVTLSVQIGATDEMENGYIYGCVYANDGKSKLNELHLDYSSEEEFDTCLRKNYRFVLAQARRYQEVR